MLSHFCEFNLESQTKTIKSKEQNQASLLFFNAILSGMRHEEAVGTKDLSSQLGMMTQKVYLPLKF